MTTDQICSVRGKSRTMIVWRGIASKDSGANATMLINHCYRKIATNQICGHFSFMMSLISNSFVFPIPGVGSSGSIALASVLVSLSPLETLTIAIMAAP